MEPARSNPNPKIGRMKQPEKRPANRPIFVLIRRHLNRSNLNAVPFIGDAAPAFSFRKGLPGLLPAD
jgi:hypothetical protein